MNKKYCKNCKWFYGRHTTESLKFIIYEKKKTHKSLISGAPIKPPHNYLEIQSDLFLIKMCQHSVCFQNTENNHNEYTSENYNKSEHIKRIKGQAQLNNKGTCSYYKRKWWKFWIK